MSSGLVVDRPLPERAPEVDAPRAPASTLDSWPHTTRVLPWCVALFLAMVYLLPFDSIKLPVSLPIDPAVDRFALTLLAAVWLLISVAGRGKPRFKHAPINVAIYAFVIACGISIIVNLRELGWDGDLTPSLKQLSLVASYLAFFFIVASAVRRTEVPAFAKLMVGLAVINAVGIIYQYRSGTNLFFQLAHDVFRGATIQPPPVGNAFSRSLVSGPTRHGLADATLLSAAFPFAAVFAVDERRRGRQLMWLGAILLLLAGAVTTERKTALFIPAVCLITLVAYQPRRYIRYWPLLIPMALFTRLAAPHALSGLLYQLTNATSSSSTTTRLSDYSAVAPYLATHLLFGRGFGSFDPHKYRILDDQMLGFLVEIGVVGVVAYAGVILGGALTAHRAVRHGTTIASGIMRAVVAFSLGFLVSNFLYDTFGLRQAPYVFFFVAALGVAYAGRTTQEEKSFAADSSRILGAGALGDHGLAGGATDGATRASTVDGRAVSDADGRVQEPSTPPRSSVRSLPWWMVVALVRWRRGRGTRGGP